MRDPPALLVLLWSVLQAQEGRISRDITLRTCGGSVFRPAAPLCSPSPPALHKFHLGWGKVSPPGSMCKEGANYDGKDSGYPQRSQSCKDFESDQRVRRAAGSSNSSHALTCLLSAFDFPQGCSRLPTYCYRSRLSAESPSLRKPRRQESDLYL